jgi:hypothetical protein
MRGISTVIAKRGIEITPINAVELSIDEVSEPSTNGFWVLSDLETARSVKVAWLETPSYWQADVWRPTVAGEAKERVTRNETTKARENIVFLWVLAVFVEWRNVQYADLVFIT